MANQEKVRFIEPGFLEEKDLEEKCNEVIKEEIKNDYRLVNIQERGKEINEGVILHFRLRSENPADQLNEILDHEFREINKKLNEISMKSSR